MRILLIEDDHLVGNGVQIGLNQAGYAVDWVQEAEAGEQALLNEDYDALVLDLSLPKRDGLSVLKNLRKQNNPLPVLILTARDSVQDRIKGLDMGADDYLIVQFHHLRKKLGKELIQTIRGVGYVIRTA
jgi:DNA-binding response OmpR family regulator